MSVAILILAYNEQHWIDRVLNQWVGFHRLVLVSSKPWRGEHKFSDMTAEIARGLGVEVHEQYWKSEEDQRNWGLARLYDYDYVLIVDADELYEDPKAVVAGLDGEACYRAKEIITYWKTPEYRLDPLDKHKPVIAVDPKRIKFRELRMPMPLDDNVPWNEQPFLPVTTHHMKWVKPNRDIYEKLRIFENYNKVEGWYENVWCKWTPGSDMVVTPFQREHQVAILCNSPYLP